MVQLKWIIYITHSKQAIRHKITYNSALAVNNNNGYLIPRASKMSASLIDNAKYSSWKDSHNFDNCKLNRKEYGQFLANYLIGEKDGFVLNLNGSWGTGKTEFLKRFYVYLIDRGHPTIYIDAWESDFSQEPLTVVAIELLNQLERLMDGAISDDIITEVKGALGKALKGTLIGLAGITSAKLLNDSAIGMEAVNKLLDETPQSITKQLAENYQSQIEAIINTRDTLGNLAESLKTVNGAALPVIVLIDELDRCRPTYAIEMLEVIKHFFSISNFVFVIATDTEQLCHSIKSVYGDGFDSKQYLKRFFHRKSSLSPPDIDIYIKASEEHSNYRAYDAIKLYPRYSSSHSENRDLIQFCVSKIAYAYDLKIRDIDQLIAKTHSCLRAVCNSSQEAEKQHAINIAVLITGLIEQDLSSSSYNNRTNRSTSLTTPIKNYALSPDLDISKYITLNFESITIRTIYNQNGYANESLPGWEDYQHARGHNASLELANITSELSRYSDLHGNPNIKLWFWDDYKKIIELAGTIE